MKSHRPMLLAVAAAVAILGLETSARGQMKMSAISEKMTGVVVDLTKAETGPPVQDRQKAIVGDLDALIASLEQECQACRNGMRRNNPRDGAPDSMISRGTGGSGPLIDPSQGEKDWAKLSPRERDRILQSMSEGFPPEYRQVLERYYRRLAEEKTVAPGPASTPTGGEQAPAQEP